jgi:hypothetical protein
MKLKSNSRRIHMKDLATITLMLTIGAAGMYGETSVSMRFSGTSGNSAISLARATDPTGSGTGEYNFTGNGTLGGFNLRTINLNPTGAPAGCPFGNQPAANHPYFGTGVFRFDDGSLLMVSLTQGSDCLATSSTGQPLGAICVRVFQITGGTGRFTNASGTITLTEGLMPVLFLAPGVPASFFAVTGSATGTISMVGQGDSQNEQ